MTKLIYSFSWKLVVLSHGGGAVMWACGGVMGACHDSRGGEMILRQVTHFPCVRCVSPWYCNISHRLDPTYK